MAGNSSNIVILEPSQIVFEGISNILIKSGEYYKIYRAESIEELYAFEVKPDVLIINPSQILNKEKEFTSLKKQFPDIIKVAFVYGYFEQNLLTLFDKIIYINDSPETIIHSICRNSEHHHTELSPEQLSDREIEVLRLMTNGHSNKEIADKLFISIHTVISHRKNIIQKTGIKSQAGLTIYAISNKIIQLEDY